MFDKFYWYFIYIHWHNCETVIFDGVVNVAAELEYVGDEDKYNRHRDFTGGPVVKT